MRVDRDATAGVRREPRASRPSAPWRRATDREQRHSATMRLPDSSMITSRRGPRRARCARRPHRTGSHVALAHLVDHSSTISESRNSSGRSRRRRWSLRCAQRREHRRVLDADDAARHDGQRARDPRQLADVIAGQHRRAIHRHAGRRRGVSRPRSQCWPRSPRATRCRMRSVRCGHPRTRPAAQRFDLAGEVGARARHLSADGVIHAREELRGGRMGDCPRQPLAGQRLRRARDGDDRFTECLARDRPRLDADAPDTRLLLNDRRALAQLRGLDRRAPPGGRCIWRGGRSHMPRGRIYSPCVTIWPRLSAPRSRAR